MVSLSALSTAVLSDIDSEIRKPPKCSITASWYGFCKFITNDVPLGLAGIVGVLDKNIYVNQLHSYILERQREHFVLLEMKQAGNITGQEFGKLNTKLMQDYNGRLQVLNSQLGAGVSGERMINNVRIAELFTKSDELRERARREAGGVR